MALEPRRVKAIPVRTQDVISCFLYDQNWSKEFDTNIIQRLRIFDIPKDAKPTYGWFDAARNMFMIVMEHESFPEVPAGQVAPVAYGECFHFYINHAGEEVCPRAIERIGEPGRVKFREFL